MRILGRYVLREFITPVLYCFVAFASLYVVIDLFGESDKILSAKPPAGLVLRYVAGVLSKDFQWLVTPSILLGGLYAMWQLARHGEITAMRATGSSFALIVKPILMASVAMGLVVFANSEFFAPRATRYARIIKDQKFTDMREAPFENVAYYNYREQRDWQVAEIDPGTLVMKGVKITHIGTNDIPDGVMTAETAYYMNRTWCFENAVVTALKSIPGSAALAHESETSHALLVKSGFREKPRDFIVETMGGNMGGDSEFFSVRDMRRLLRHKPNLTPVSRKSWEYEIANRFAAPLACVVIALFAIPAGVATGRQSVFVGVLTAILLFLLFYVMNMTFGVFTKKGALPLWIGATTPDLVMFAAGLYMFRKQR